MKLWKKVLIGVAVLAAIGLGLLGYGAMKVGDIYTEKIKPDMQNYVQMTKEEQDKYIISHMKDLMGDVKDDDKVNLELEAIENDPDVRQACIEVGRSLCASLIAVSDDIMDGLSSEDKEKYEQEGKALESRSDRFEELVKKYEERTKK